MGCVTQLRWKGQKFDQHMGPIEEQVEQNSLVLVAYVRPLPTRMAEFADDLSALTVDIEHWQQKKCSSGLWRLQCTHWAPGAESLPTQ
jgi:hypothetical protein